MIIPSTIHWLNQLIDLRMKRILTTVCLVLSLSVSAQNRQPAAPMQAQRPNNQFSQFWNPGQMNRQQQQQQMPNRSGQFSPAEYWKQQKEFFTQKACLTDKEAEAFFPLYNELQQKKREINREIRMIMRQEANAETSEEQSLKAIDAKADANIKIANLEKEYLQKFKEVLPASKILKVQNAEEQFNSQILKDIQQSRGHQFMQQSQQTPQFGQPTAGWFRPNAQQDRKE